MLKRPILGYSKCLGLLPLALIRLHMFNKFLESVAKKKEKEKKIREELTQMLMRKLKLKPKHVLKTKLDNKRKQRKLRKKDVTKRRKGSKNKLTKKNLKDNNAKLKSKRDKCNSNSKWSKKK